ncbi:glycoside hydrolase family 16 protein [Pisolithus orientalis]|uniref:glycoside hydrolase family 16 protein n=1 Tax=Pisolithus orientalis TaxID=936130 RepID=UPI0022258E57|nr:glycoside hydrolase family 16 protein [Pisolithus orientalis]KAI5997324.1 glycoside hydrolase family 16 protein [Pisolithus orientalis]
MVGLVFFSIFALLASTGSAYDVIREYSGSTFFDGWDFYGAPDNLTLGNVTWLSETDAISQGLAYVNNQGHVILKVDNTTNVTYGQERNSVRITTQDAYELGSFVAHRCKPYPLRLFGDGHLASGKRPKWPDDGEIDIIEGINLMTYNQMAIHTTAGCTHSGSVGQLGTNGLTTDCSQPSGCTVIETLPNSFQSGFAASGGGVWATRFDTTGIYIWFWSRPDIPLSISQATSTSSLDLSDWGTPHANFSSSTCNMIAFFTPQNLVLDITLCGDWAGLSWDYDPTCGSSGPTGLCYNDCVVGPGSPLYDTAYWDISYIRTYTSSVSTPSPSGSPASSSSSATRTSTTATSISSAASTDTNIADTPPFLQPIGSGEPHVAPRVSWRMALVYGLIIVVSSAPW